MRLVAIDSCLLVCLLSIFSFIQLAMDLSSSRTLFLTRNFLLCGISLMSSAAFCSAYLQLAGLLGDHGLIPLSKTLLTLRTFIRNKDMNIDWIHPDAPMTFMLRLVYEKFSITGQPDQQISTFALIDVIISLVSIVYPHPVLFAYMYISYYSIKRVGGRFFNFQWDALLLETLFVAVLLSMAYDTQTIAMCMWAMKALLFRLMFGSGVVKVFSRDESWNVSFTAMAHHFLTQPLPSSFGMYVHNHLSKFWFRLLTQGSLVAEFVFPLLSLVNVGWANYAICFNYVVLQASIAATGYYGFFNYLTMVLSISLLDDAVLINALHFVAGHTIAARLLEVISIYSYYSTDYSKVRVMSVFQLLFRAGCSCILYPALVLLVCSHVVSCYLLAERVGCVRNSLSTQCTAQDQQVPVEGATINASVTQPNTLLHHCYIKIHYLLRTTILPLHDTLLRSFCLGNHYGLFATMTKSRNEITIEVSHDKVQWQMVEFLAKPGNIDLPPKAIWFFHLPRLDWVMWFLAFRPGKEDLPMWFWELLVSILSGEHGNVLQLLHPTLNPDIVTQQGDRKCEYVRVSLVNYQFSGSATVASGASMTTTNATTTESTPATTATTATPTTIGTYWTTKRLATILPPTTLLELHSMLDALDPTLQQHAAQRRPPTAEDAKEIIMRTLFNKLQSKNQSQQAKSNNKDKDKEQKMD